MNLTLQMLKDWDACDYASRVVYFAGRESIPAMEIAKDDTLSYNDRLWALTRLLTATHGIDAIVLFAESCASRAWADAAAARAARAARDAWDAWDDAAAAAARARAARAARARAAWAARAAAWASTDARDAYAADAAYAAAWAAAWAAADAAAILEDLASRIEAL